MHLFQATQFKRFSFFLLVDICISYISLYTAYHLRFNFDVPAAYMEHFFSIFLLLTLFKIIALYFFRGYRIVWRFFAIGDMLNILKAHLIAYILFVGLFLVLKEYFTPFARSILIIDFMLSFMLFLLIRVLKRAMLSMRHKVDIKPTLIIGVNGKTNTVVQSALNGEIEYNPVAIVALESEDSFVHQYIHNIEVYAVDELENILTKKNIKSIIITEDLETTPLSRLVNQLNSYGIYDIKKVKIVGSKDEKLEDLSIEDLLARHPKDLDLETIQSFIQDKNIVITGAGGSIGSDIARQCYKFGAKKLTLIDNSEYNLYQIGEVIPSARLSLLNITDRVLTAELFHEIKPDIVIHAAAYKHVPLCEANQEIAVHNNIRGLQNIVDISIEEEVKKVVIISTDKAVRPTNVMGATKRVGELYASNVYTTKTEIVAVRFGNVLGSSGSVIPKFKKQIEEGGPITVTHPDITRYFMLIPEACQLVLQAAAIAKGGELFILDMGEPIKISDMAKQMIRLYGKENEIDIVYTGLREGEKLYEELLIDESEQKTKYSSITIARSTQYDITQLNQDIKMLLEEKDKIKFLKRIVPEFTHL